MPLPSLSGKPRCPLDRRNRGPRPDSLTTSASVCLPRSGQAVLRRAHAALGVAGLVPDEGGRRIMQPISACPGTSMMTSSGTPLASNNVAHRAAMPQIMQTSQSRPAFRGSSSYRRLTYAARSGCRRTKRAPARVPARSRLAPGGRCPVAACAPGDGGRRAGQHDRPPRATRLEVCNLKVAIPTIRGRYLRVSVTNVNGLCDECQQCLLPLSAW